LLRIAGDKEELLVADVAAVLHWPPSSKTFRNVKKSLEERGWVWKDVKRKGVVKRVIIVPKR
jgi:sirohydrochlorin ferrochelatase